MRESSAVIVVAMVTAMAILPPALSDAAGPRVDFTVGTMPFGRTGMAAVWNGTHVLLFGGLNESWAPTDEIWSYSPTSGEFQKKGAILPRPKLALAAFWAGEYVYLLGGKDALRKGTTDILRYDPVRDSVEHEPSALPYPLYGSAGFWDGAHVYLFGGLRDSLHSYANITRYDPFRHHAEVLSETLPTEQYGVMASWTGQYGLVLGHIYPDHPVLRFESDRERLFETQSLLPLPRTESGASWDGTAMYVFGGWADYDEWFHEIVSDRVWRYDPGADELRVLEERLPHAMRNPAAAFDGRSTFLFGSSVPWPGKPDNRFVRFDHGIPALQPFAAIAPIPVVECLQGGAFVQLDGRGSKDPAGGLLSYAWSSTGANFDDPASSTPVGWFPKGITSVKLTVAGAGGSHDAFAKVRVEHPLSVAVGGLDPPFEVQTAGSCISVLRS